MPPSAELAVETPILIATLRRDGVLVLRVKPHTTITHVLLEDTATSLAPLIADMMPLRCLLLIDGLLGIELKARRVFSRADAQASWCSRLAIVARTPLGRVLGTVLMGIGRGPMPTRLFGTTASAEAWIAESGEAGAA